MGPKTKAQQNLIPQRRQHLFFTGAADHEINLITVWFDNRP